MATDVFDELVTNPAVTSEDDDISLFKYAKNVIACQMEVKSIQDDIKAIKSEARENGVLTKEIDGAITQLKKRAKMMPQEAKLQEEVLEKLEGNKDIMDSISMIV